MNAAEDAVEQIKQIAAQHLEAAAEDLELVDGTVQVKGVPGSSMTLKEIASISMSMTSGQQPVLGRGGSGITRERSRLRRTSCGDRDRRVDG